MEACECFRPSLKLLDGASMYPTNPASAGFVFLIHSEATKQNFSLFARLRL